MKNSEAIDRAYQIVETKKLEAYAMDNLLFGVEIACKQTIIETCEEIQEKLSDLRGELAMVEGVNPAKVNGIVPGQSWLVQMHGNGPILRSVHVTRVTQFAVELYDHHDTNGDYRFWVMTEDVTWVEQVNFRDEEGMVNGLCSLGG